MSDSFLNLRDGARNDAAAGGLTLPEIRRPSFVAQFTPLENLPGWNELTPEQQQKIRAVHPDGFRQ